LRSRDRRMPEEVNRLVTDALADLLWTPSPDADDNLRAEGVPESRIARVGNIMIDSYELQRPRIETARTYERFGLKHKAYGAVTIRACGTSFLDSSYGHRFSSRQKLSNSVGLGSFALNRSIKPSRSDWSTRA